MRFLTEFEFACNEIALSVFTTLLNLYNENGYITYADILIIGVFEPNDKNIPDLYYKVGWSNILNMSVNDNVLIMPPISNIENKIKYIKENRNEQTSNENI